MPLDLKNLIIDTLKEITYAAMRVTPDVEGGFAVYLFGSPQYEGGWAKQAAIMVDGDGMLTLYLRDRRTPNAIVEDLMVDNLHLAKERIASFLHE